MCFYYMADKRKTYEATYTPGKKGVFAISLVEDPAMEEHFIAMGKQQTFQFKSVDEEKRLLVGLAMEPDKLIPRSDKDGNEFDIVFRAETIKELAYNFFKEGNQHNSKMEHVNWIDGVTIVESWIKTDDKHDKSVALGYENPVGSWYVGMKVDNDDIWENFVKTGRVKGFSVDAMLGLKEINLKNETMNLLQRLKLAKPEVTLGSVKSGDADIMFEGETLKEGIPVWLEAEDGEKKNIPAGTYELTEEKKNLVIDDNSQVESIQEMEAENNEEENESQETAQFTEEEVAKIKSVIAEFSKGEDRFKKLEDSLVEMKKANEELSEKNVELNKKIEEIGEQPAATETIANPTPVVELNAQGRILNKLRNAK